MKSQVVVVILYWPQTANKITVVELNSVAKASWWGLH